MIASCAASSFVALLSQNGSLVSFRILLPIKDLPGPAARPAKPLSD
jgi:hypothetical protein